MAFLLRSALRAPSSRLPQPLLAPTLAAFVPRFNSSSSSSPASSPSSSSSPDSTARRNNPFNKLVFDLPEGRSTISSSSNPDDAEFWWMTASKLAAARHGDPTKHYSGRSVPMSPGGDYLAGYKRLSQTVRNGNLKREERLNQYHERPGAKRQRLASERHRKRFKNMVREKVQQVMSMRNR